MNKYGVFVVAVAALAFVAVSLVDFPDSSRNSDTALAELEDRLEIERLTATYAWAVDRKDLDRQMSIFVEGEPGVDTIYPIYDISPIKAPGLKRVEGYAAIREFLQTRVYPSEPWAFSSISNVEIVLEAGGMASGGDYYVHEGFIPAEVRDGKIIRIYSPFEPDTFDLLCSPRTLARRTMTGQHLYEFIRDDRGRWKVWKMTISPLYSSRDEIVDADQISPAKKPWNPLFDQMASCEKGA